MRPLIGDRLLKQAAQRLVGELRKSNTVARLGEPFLFEAIRCRIGASIGIALYPAHGKSAEALIIEADHAMYEAKKAGKNRYRPAAVPSVPSGMAA